MRFLANWSWRGAKLSFYTHINLLKFQNDKKAEPNTYEFGPWEIDRPFVPRCKAYYLRTNHQINECTILWNNRIEGLSLSLKNDLVKPST